MKEEHLEVVVVFLSGSDIFAVLPTGFGKSICYACLPFCFFELLGETEEKLIVVVVTPLTAIMVTYLIRIKLYEHTSGLHKSKYCMMPDPFPTERFGKGSRYARLNLHFISNSQN